MCPSNLLNHWLCFKQKPKKQTNEAHKIAKMRKS